MITFNKTEIVGISVTLIIVVAGFAALKYFSLDTIDPGVFTDEQEERAPVELPENTGTNQSEMMQVLTSALSSSGEVDELVIQDADPGEGRRVEDGDILTVHYTGLLKDGTHFDSSRDDGEPFTFTLGTGEVIEGWDKGLRGMKIGGTRILIIPSEMGYGDQSVGNIPRNATLLFAVELLDVE